MPYALVVVRGRSNLTAWLWTPDLGLDTPPKGLKASARSIPILAGVDHIESVALGVGEDDVVRISRSLVPEHLRGSTREQPLDLAGLIVRVEVEVDARGTESPRSSERRGRVPSLGRRSTKSSRASPRRS